MDARKWKRLEAKGLAVGSTRDFLRLTPEDEALIEKHFALSAALRRRRQNAGVSKTMLARRIGSSQSCVAKMEAGDPWVSLELLISALIALGATPQQLGRALAVRVA